MNDSRAYAHFSKFFKQFNTQKLINYLIFGFDGLTVVFCGLYYHALIIIIARFRPVFVDKSEDLVMVL